MKRLIGFCRFKPCWVIEFIRKHMTIYYINECALLKCDKCNQSVTDKPPSWTDFAGFYI